MKVILHVDIPEDVTENDLKEFINFKFMGHSIDSDVASKFDYEELNVYDWDIEK